MKNIDTIGTEKASQDVFEDLKYTLPKIRRFVLNEDTDTKKLLQKIDIFLKNEFSESQEHSEKRLEIIFYSLVVKLRLFQVETPEIARLFHLFIGEMEYLTRKIIFELQQNEQLMQNFQKKGIFNEMLCYFNEINARLRILNHQVQLNQILAFLYICENYIHTIKGYYKDMSMSSRVLELYITRMNIKGSRYFFNKEYGMYMGFGIFRIISSYGTSFMRLAITCTLSVIFFASIYWYADYFAPENVRMIPHLTDFSNYFFNSLVTISGLGIDASPQTTMQRVAMGINTIYGMIVFGMLFNVISTKLSINS